jgi:serine/threonine protein kinase
MFAVRTYLYMAPEVLLHSHPFDQKADVFSVGVIMFELLTKKFLSSFAPLLLSCSFSISSVDSFYGTTDIRSGAPVSWSCKRVSLVL